MKKKDLASISQVFMVIAFVTIALSAIGYMGVDIWLASTQWLLVTAVLALFGVYLKLESKK